VPGAKLLDLSLRRHEVIPLIAPPFSAHPGVFDIDVGVTALPHPLAVNEDAPTPRAVTRSMSPDPELIG
jgi:hypothetical protein